MIKIVFTHDLNLFPDQIKKLETLGELKLYSNPASAQEWLERCSVADIVCSESSFMKNEIYGLKDKYFNIPMVGYSWLDLPRLRENNITVSNCPGCNKYAVSEWIIAMMINLLRKFPSIINHDSKATINQPGIGLFGKSVTILGQGNIGSTVGEICRSFGMNVTFFDYHDNLYSKTENSDIIINCLATDPTTSGILNKQWFSGLKKGVYLISITTDDIFDLEALFSAIDEGIIAGFATDCASVSIKDDKDNNYLKYLNHPKILATPHIAYNTDNTHRTANDMMIENIESWLKGKPQNVIS